MKKSLSIIIITMNRAKQLCEAIHSCLSCILPEVTEIIVLDNASSDETSEYVKKLSEETLVKIKYLQMQQNIGAGPGRNYAIKYAIGDYIYFLDDDAIIDVSNKNFFIDAIEILERYPEIATLTTQIYDTAWKANRVTKFHIELYNGIYKCYIPCGGSHFLRRSYFDLPIFFTNLYGFEEFSVAMQARNKGYENVSCPSLLVIHKPKVNKWVVKTNNKHFINEFACQYGIKCSLYPKIVIPILWVAYQIRYVKYLRGSGLRSEGKMIITDLLEKGKEFKRIKISTLYQLYKDFGLSIF